MFDATDKALAEPPEAGCYVAPAFIELLKSLRDNGCDEFADAVAYEGTKANAFTVWAEQWEEYEFSPASGKDVLLRWEKLLRQFVGSGA